MSTSARVPTVSDGLFKDMFWNISFFLSLHNKSKENLIPKHYHPKCIMTEAFLFLVHHCCALRMMEDTVLHCMQLFPIDTIGYFLAFALRVISF